MINDYEDVLPQKFFTLVEFLYKEAIESSKNETSGMVPHDV
jgi:hypothetical protein